MQSLALRVLVPDAAWKDSECASERMLKVVKRETLALAVSTRN